MVSRRRLDDRPIARRGPTRAPLRRILVVCEGRETERRYIEAFQHAVRNPRVHVEVARETGVPKTVVKEAIALRERAEQEALRERDENLRWVLDFGRMHPGYEEALRRATALAERAARDGEAGRNPTTDVPRLTESIRSRT